MFSAWDPFLVNGVDVYQIVCRRSVYWNVLVFWMNLEDVHQMNQCSVYILKCYKTMLNQYEND